MEGFWGLWLISWIASVVGVAAMTLCLACGLYYLAELVEEYTMLAKKYIKISIYVIISMHVVLLITDGLPMLNIFVGLVAHSFYLLLLPTFPFIDLFSGQFIGACILMVVDHLLWFWYFGEVWHPFSHVVGFFGLCVWMVPFAFFISLSANEAALPMPGGHLGALPNEKQKKRGGLYKTTFEMVQRQMGAGSGLGASAEPSRGAGKML